MRASDNGETENSTHPTWVRASDNGETENSTHPTWVRASDNGETENSTHPTQSTHVYKARDGTVSCLPML